MAEGDTIHRAARRLGGALIGQVLEVKTPSPRAKSSGLGRLSGKRLENVEARGKHLLLRFDGALVLHSHLGMNGSWHVYERGERWRKSPASAWVVLQSERFEAVQWGGPTLRLIPAGRVAIDPVLSRLGPDLLDPGFDIDAGVARLLSRPERELGDALLDQQLICGIGNIFKNEGCFAAKADPWAPIGALDRSLLTDVVAKTRAMMVAAVESGRQPKRIYRRAAGPCPGCRGRVRSHGQGDANRTTYWCPECQSRRPPAA